MKMEALNSNMLLHFQNKELDGPKEELLTFYITKLCFIKLLPEISPPFTPYTSPY